jgi:hypothetical protein
MLKLPNDWKNTSGDSLAALLVAQLPELRLQAELLRNLIAASLESSVERTDSPTRDLLLRYNKRIADSSGDDRLLVGIPNPTTYRTIAFRVPTYDPDGPVEHDYNRTENVTLKEEHGLRAIMGNPDSLYAPNLLIERAVGLWRLIVHADAGDPLCIIEFTLGRATIETDEGTLLLERI